MKNQWLAIAIYLTLSALPVLAHHPPSSEFDSSHTLTIKGVVTRVDWTNPHVWFYVDVKGTDGKVVTWGIETSAPHALNTKGIDKDLLPVGTTVTVAGWMAKMQSSKRLGGQTLTLASGRVLDIHDSWADGAVIPTASSSIRK